MGNTLYRPSEQLDIQTSLNELSFLTDMKPIGNGKFMKSAQCKSEHGFVLVKVYKKTDKSLDLHEHQEYLNYVRNKINPKDFPNLAPLYKSFAFNDSSYAFVIRQFFYSNLYDRLSTHPFLTPIEKKWYAYQCIKAVEQLHKSGFSHGDIKCENFMVTSWGWVLLTDFGYFKPTYLAEDGNTFARFTYFFESQGRELCYLAPEHGKKDFSIPPGRDLPLKESMDIFSLGCVLFELFFESQPLFDLNALMKYRDGEYDPIPAIKKLQNPLLEEMILSMISRNPEERLTASQYLEKYTGDDSIFPSSFDSYYYPLFLKAIDEEITTGDQHQFHCTDKDHCASFDKIAKELEHTLNSVYKGVTIPSPKPIERNRVKTRENCIQETSGETGDINSVLEKLKGIVSQIQTHSERYETMQMKEGETGETIPVTCSSSNTTPRLEDSETLLILSILTSSIRNVSVPYSKFVGILLLTEISKYLSEDILLQRILPYLITLLKQDETPTVKAASVHAITFVLNSISILPESDEHLFTEYILPCLSPLLQDTNVTVRLALAESLPSIFKSGKRFLDLCFVNKKVSAAKKNDKEETTYDEYLYRIQMELDNYINKFLAESGLQDSIVRCTTLQNLPALLSLFPKESLSILTMLSTFFNDRDPYVRAIFMRMLPSILSFFSYSVISSTIVEWLSETLYDDNEIVIYYVLKCVQYMAKHKYLTVTQVQDVVVKICPLLLHPREYLRNEVLDTICCFTTIVQEPEIQVLLAGILQSYFTINLFTIPWEKDYLVSYLQSPVSAYVYDELCVDIKNGRELYSRHSSISIPYLSTMELDLETKKSLLSLYITESLKKKHLQEPTRNHSSFSYPRIRASSVVNLQTSLQSTKYIPSAFDEESIRNGYLPSFIEIPTSKIVDLLNRDNSNNNGELEKLVYYYGLDTVHTGEPNVNVYTRLKFNTMTIEDFVEYKTLLNTLQLPPCPPSLGGLVNPDGTSFKITDESILKDREYRPQGSCLYTHNADQKPINKIAISKDSLYFLTSSESGMIYYYQTKGLGTKSDLTHDGQYNTHSEVNDLTVCDNSRTFVAVTKDSHLHIVRSDIFNNTPSSVILNKKISDISLSCVTHYNSNFNSNVLYTSKNGDIYMYDIRSNSHINYVNISPKLGCSTSISMCSNNSGVLIGTSLGYISLLDLRFPLFTNCWKHPSNCSITKLYTSHNYDNTTPDPYIWCLNGKNYVECWDLDQTKLIKRLCVLTDEEHNVTDDNYLMRRVDPSHIVQSYTDKSPLFVNVYKNSINSLFSLRKKDYILSAGSDRTIRLWDLENVQNSYTVVGTTMAARDHKYSLTNKTIFCDEQNIKISRSDFNLPSNENHDHLSSIQDVAVITRPHHFMVTAGRDGAVKALFKAKGFEITEYNGTDDNCLMFRKRLFKISQRTDYPQVFIEVKPCIYVFIGGYEEIQDLADNDTIPQEELDANPDLPTFYRVFKQFIDDAQRPYVSSAN
ncbi:hypothetical protein WA158_005268 [Blastocystis sp. Blastoise]